MSTLTLTIPELARVVAVATSTRDAVTGNVEPSVVDWGTDDDKKISTAQYDAGGMEKFAKANAGAMIATLARMPVLLPSFSASGLPSAAANTGALIFVPDEIGGAVPAFSDGTNWRRVTDRNVVS